MTPSTLFGAYALLLEAVGQQMVQVGKLGRFPISKGVYVYIGSAFGPGGLRSRIERHFRKKKTLRWHIDYLRAVTRPVAVWYTTSRKKVECRLAACFQKSGGAVLIPGFGSSDCRCRSHLFYFQQMPSRADIAVNVPFELSRYDFLRMHHF